MKKFFLLVAVTLIAAIYFSRPANASSMREYAAERINQNKELRSTIESMGYTPASAAVAFEKAYEELEANNLDRNNGTLAICGSASARLIFIGAEGEICTTFFNAFRIVNLSFGSGENIGFSARATADAVFFKTADGNNFEKNKKHCFAGLELFTAEMSLGIGENTAKEIDCTEYPNINFKNGFFFAVKVGYGTSLDFKLNIINVTHLKTYKW